MAKIRCEKCNLTMEEKNFYTYKNGSKAEICKKCLTMHIDLFDPSTYEWIMKKMDVPHIPVVLKNIINKAYAKDPNKIDVTALFGKYISQMKLKQFKNYGWDDTETVLRMRGELEEDLEAKAKEKEEFARQQLEEGIITEAEYKTMIDASTILENNPNAPTKSAFDLNKNNLYKEENFLKEEDLPDPAKDLTSDDKIYLAMKWGRLYQPTEWVELERSYMEMCNSFDIQDADTTQSLILICKTNLKMNQALDCGDIEGFNKLSKTYDTLRKSARFTAAQNKEDKEDFVDCVGNLVAYCEKNGGAIPKFDTKIDLDVIDKVINDLKKYTRSLIYEDKALAQQIEAYLKNREASDKQKRDRKEAEEKGLNCIPIKDEDIQEYYDAIEKDRQSDEITIEGADI